MLALRTLLTLRLCHEALEAPWIARFALARRAGADLTGRARPTDRVTALAHRTVLAPRAHAALPPRREPLEPPRVARLALGGRARAEATDAASVAASTAAATGPRPRGTELAERATNRTLEAAGCADRAAAPEVFLI
jgi:hypothetical protein